MNYFNRAQAIVQRRPVLALSFLIAAILLIGACTKNKAASDSREVADHFVDLYYGRMNMAEAVKLCSGAALTKLEAQMNNVKGVQPDSPSGEPQVTFEMTVSDKPSANEATYTYRVTAHTSDVAPILAMLVVSAQDGRWTISSFSEKKAPTG